MATDGLWDNLFDSEVQELVQQSGRRGEADSTLSALLVEAAYERGVRPPRIATVPQHSANGEWLCAAACVRACVRACFQNDTEIMTPFAERCRDEGWLDPKMAFRTGGKADDITVCAVTVAQSV